MGKDTLFVDIDEIIKLAENFKCCPICGNENATHKYCKICKQKYEEKETSIFFGIYLRKLKNKNELDPISNKKEEDKEVNIYE